MTKKSIPGYLEHTVVALAYWLGYQRARYGRHMLPEGAIAAETWHLLAAGLDRSLELVPELAYETILRSASEQGADQGERVDLAVLKRLRTKGRRRERRGVLERIEQIIEIKRWKGSRSERDDDLERIYTCLQVLPRRVRGFMLLAAEGAPPKTVLTAKGFASRKAYETKRGFAWADVRVARTAHGAASWGSPSYVVLLEVRR